MITKETTIVNRLGLHTRAAAKLAKEASHYSSKVSVSKGIDQVDGKSIMGLMMISATQGSTIELVVEGEDEVEAMDALINLIANHFEEEE
ncbi:MAG: HPr family phosphocarrier protein [Arenicellales bacterium]|nr:phosphocarrier protein HPr [Acidiferrobacteraceae bacterium]MDP6123189.1 HPr family phosphocarrier protein [Arenicellales bacterium]MBT59621.1 phosphocarrier protein HPr [Acidiferrobacteraceae bacterium]MDP6288726.1 HPr family phosphocarrier protein [Arenicellales bacterium]MDP6434986.1 HPr family phosphocarrier protein [Arenicellales bacterium]